MVFGGSFGMVFGDYTALNISPQVGYAFNKYLTAGGGISAMIYYDVVQYKSNGVNYSPYGDQLVYSVGYVFNF